MPFEKFNRERLRILSLTQREHKMTLKDILSLDYRVDFNSPDLEILAQKVVDAHKNRKQIIWVMGAHILRRGNALFVLDLLERGIISHVAVNHAVAIHDFELAHVGATLEDVEYYIKDGRFGHWDETGRFMNEAVKKGFHDGIGLGEAIGEAIENGFFLPMPHKEISIFAAAYRLKIPITVHKGIGYDITDQHPSADFEAIGKTSGDDFLIFARSIQGLEGGVFLNFGSSVMGPEVYLKALSMARNVASQEGREVRHFTTAVFDLVDLGNWKQEEGIVDYRKSGAMADQRYYFRPLKSILVRTVKDGGESFYIQGDFALTVPALYRLLTEQKA